MYLSLYIYICIDMSSSYVVTCKQQANLDHQYIKPKMAKLSCTDT